MRVLSTYKILKMKAFNEDIDECWVDWAIEMIETGYESENLYMLAGVTKPYNQFKLQELTNKVLVDLKFDDSDERTIIKNYVYYLISTSIDHPEIYLKTLRELKDICMDLHLDAKYMDFYLLYYAKDELVVDEFQSYWAEANRENIDKIIKEQFQIWMNEFEQSGTIPPEL